MSHERPTASTFDLVLWAVLLLAVIALLALSGADVASKFAHIGTLVVVFVAGLIAFYRTTYRPWSDSRREKRQVQHRYITMLDPESQLNEDLKLHETLRTIMDGWHSTVDLIKDERTRRMMATFLAQYAQEESSAIQGNTHAHRHFVVTRFLTYSTIVTALIQEALRQYNEFTIVCFTTLPMRLTRWFNYRTPPTGQDDLQALAGDKDWESYKQELRRLVDTDRLTLTRCLLSTTTTHAHLPDVAIATRDTMIEDGNCAVLLRDLPHLKNDWPSLAPFEHRQITEIIAALQRLENGAGREIAATIQTLYGSKKIAYVIVPRKPEELPPVPEHEWITVRRAFEMSAHEHPSRCKEFCFDEKGFEEWFDCDYVEQMPEDFFAIGIKSPAAGDTVVPTWQFCLAGNVGKDISRVTLEIFINGTSRADDRYRRFMEYLNHLWSNAS